MADDIEKHHTFAYAVIAAYALGGLVIGLLSLILILIATFI